MLWTAILLPLMALEAAAAINAVVIDCKNAPQSCNNDCYAVYAAGKPSTLNYLGPNKQGKNRIAAGCGSSRAPCKKTNYKKSGDSCDEYPFASTKEGGTGAILRCVPLADNKAEGNQLGTFYKKGAKKGGCANKPCQFLFFTKNYSNKTPFCTIKKGTKPKNDGYEFKLQNGKYVNARMAAANLDFETDIPDPSLFIPFEMRREFELNDGTKVLLLSGDMETTFNGTMIANGDSEDSEPNWIVRELVGEQKSSWFQPEVHI